MLADVIMEAERILNLPVLPQITRSGHREFTRGAAE
jgi:hypothetical protein